MNCKSVSLVTMLGLVFASSAEPGEKGKTMQLHTSNIGSIKAIQEHLMVSGESHEGLWLGPNLLFRPGDPPEDMHVFLGASDRRGGDSIQEQLHFTCPDVPRESAGFAAWRDKWKQQAYPEALAERVEDGYRFVPTFNWKFHAASGKGLGFGHVLRHRGKALSDHLAHVAIAYSVYDPATQSFALWRSFRIRIDGEEKPCVAYGQRVDLPNGDILLPFSTIKELKGWNSMRWCGSARCRFDGEKVEVLDVGNLVTHPVPRGFVEPSMAAHGNRYFMTLRAQDGHSHVTVSEDGLTWADPIPWRWDDGEAIAMDQTMAKFISCPAGLFLVYTRITDDNGKVFRHRAPLFLSQVNPEAVCLIRATESTLLANRGFPVGNFKVHEISPRETWVTAPEWDRSGKDVTCDNRLTRILWE